MENDIWKMGAAVEIRDIKIINQCLEVQGAVVTCLFSVCLSPYVHLLLCSSLFLFLTHFSPDVSPVKVVLNAATHESAPQGQPQPLIWQ